MVPARSWRWGAAVERGVDRLPGRSAAGGQYLFSRTTTACIFASRYLPAVISGGSGGKRSFTVTPRTWAMATRFWMVGFATRPVRELPRSSCW